MNTFAVGVVGCTVFSWANDHDRALSVFVSVCLCVRQHESFRQQQADKVAADSEVYFLKQTAGNSCGTVALLHAVANNKSKPTFGECRSNKQGYHRYQTGKTPLVSIDDSVISPEVSYIYNSNYQSIHYFHVVS